MTDKQTAIVVGAIEEIGNQPLALGSDGSVVALKEEEETKEEQNGTQIQGIPRQTV